VCSVSSYERYVDWLDEALDDYEVAMELYKLKRYSKACFFSQQASEKALKALMIKKMKTYVDTRSVAELFFQFHVLDSWGLRFPLQSLPSHCLEWLPAGTAVGGSPHQGHLN